MTIQSIKPLHTAKQASRLVEIQLGNIPATLTDTIFSLSHRDFVRHCSQSMHHRKTMILMRAKNSNGTSVGKFFNF